MSVTAKVDLFKLYNVFKVDEVKSLLNETNMNTEDYYGNTLLHYAARYNDLGLVNALIEKGAKENIKNKLDKTPFDMAIDTRKDLLSDSKIHISSKIVRSNEITTNTYICDLLKVDKSPQPSNQQSQESNKDVWFDDEDDDVEDETPIVKDNAEVKDQVSEEKPRSIPLWMTLGLWGGKRRTQKSKVKVSRKRKHHMKRSRNKRRNTKKH